MVERFERWKKMTYTMMGIVLFVELVLSIVFQGWSIGYTIRNITKFIGIPVATFLLVIFAQTQFHKDWRYLAIPIFLFYQFALPSLSVVMNGFLGALPSFAPTIQQIFVFATLVLAVLILFRVVKDLKGFKITFLISVVWISVRILVFVLRGPWLDALREAWILVFLISLGTLFFLFEEKILSMPTNKQQSRFGVIYSSTDYKTKEKQRLLDDARKQKDQGFINEWEYLDLLEEIQKKFEQ